MKRHIKNGLITTLIAFILLALESIVIEGFEIRTLLHILLSALSIGLLVGFAVFYMDRK